MKILRASVGMFVLGLLFTMSGYARPVKPGCDSIGRIGEVFYTSCFPWVNTTTDGADLNVTFGTTTYTRHNDTARLKFLLESSTTIGKVVFDETAYYVDDSIKLYSFRTVIGTGRSSVPDPSLDQVYLNSRVVQTANKPIFTIGGGIRGVAVRDIALVAAAGVTGAIGIQAQNGTTVADSYQSIDFEFTNITFSGLKKGIYINAQQYGQTPQNPNPCQSNGSGCPGYWRFDNVKLDHLKFEGCRIGVHTNSKNLGLSMKNIHFYVPTGDPLPPNDKDGYATPVTNADNLTMGVYLQRVGYATLDLLIADGVYNSQTGDTSTAFIYVGEHANLTIQSSIDEGFRNSIYVFGGDINSPVMITNNTIQSLLTIRNSTVVSSGNQFSRLSTSSASIARAIESSKVYSIGDRFCLDYAAGSSTCTEGTGANVENYETDASSQVVFNSNRYRTTLFNLRFGTEPYQYDIARNVNNGILEFKGAQSTPSVGYAGYSFETPGGSVKVNYDGSVTYGSKTYSDLIANTGLLGAPPDGTVVFCSNCTKTTPCGLGTSANGALAKRLHGSWDCD